MLYLLFALFYLGLYEFLHVIIKTSWPLDGVTTKKDFYSPPKGKIRTESWKVLINLVQRKLIKSFLQTKNFKRDQSSKVFSGLIQKHIASHQVMYFFKHVLARRSLRTFVLNSISTANVGFLYYFFLSKHRPTYLWNLNLRIELHHCSKLNHKTCPNWNAVRSVYYFL